MTSDPPAAALATNRTNAAVRPALLLGALFLVALNLRAALTSLPPLVGDIESHLGLSGFSVGLLTTFPVACMGLFAPLAQRLADRVGREIAITAALVLLTVGLLARLGAGYPAVLFASTIAAGVGIAITQTLVPGFVKEHFAARAGRATGIYSTGMSIGAAVAASAAVPLGDAAGSWQLSLASWTVLGVLGLSAWLPVAVRPVTRGGMRPARVAPQRGTGSEATGVTTSRSRRLPWHSRTAWLVAGYLACQSTLFYGQVAWIAPAYHDHGYSDQHAGLLFALYTVANLMAAVSVPALCDHVVDRRPLLFGMLACSLVGLSSLVAFPTALPWLFLAILGFGQGGGFVLGLVLLVDYAPDPAASGRLSGMVFLIGYSAAALFPALLGALRDLTGGLDVPFTVLLAIDSLQLLVITRLRPFLRV